MVGLQLVELVDIGRVSYIELPSLCPLPDHLLPSLPTIVSVTTLWSAPHWTSVLSFCCLCVFVSVSFVLPLPVRLSLAMIS